MALIDGSAAQTTTINDDEPALPTVTLAVDQAAIDENPAGTATFTATLSNPSAADVTVDLGFAGSADLTDDYTRSGAQIVIAAKTEAR